jgi:hypothetical protein
MNPCILGLFRQELGLFHETIKILTCRHPSKIKKALSSISFSFDYKKQNREEKT